MKYSFKNIGAKLKTAKQRRITSLQKKYPDLAKGILK